MDNNLLLNLITFGTYGKLVRACCNEIDMHSKVLQLGGTFGNQLGELAESVGYYGKLDVMDINRTQLSRLAGKYETQYPQMKFIHANAEDAIEGEYDSKEYNSDILFQFVKVPYDIEKELEDEAINIEKEDYKFELTEGRYRNMEKVEKYFKDLGVEI